MTYDLIIDGTIFGIQQNGGVSKYLIEILIAIEESGLNYLIISPNATAIRDIIPDIKIRRTMQSTKIFVPLLLGDLKTKVYFTPYYRNTFEKVPTIATVHDFTHKKFMKGISPFFYFQNQKKVVQKSERVIVPSITTQIDLINFTKAPKERINIVKHGGYEQRSLTEKDIDYIFIGSRAPYKNFNLGLKFLNSTGAQTISIVGGGPLVSNELKLLAKYSITPTHYENVSDEQVKALLDRSKFLLYPSKSEGFGIPIIEAISCHCYPIVQHGTACSELLPKNYPGQMDFDECTSLDSNDFISTLYGYDFNNLQRFASKFNWSSSRERHLEIIRELLNN